MRFGTLKKLRTEYNSSVIQKYNTKIKYTIILIIFRQYNAPNFLMVSSKYVRKEMRKQISYIISSFDVYFTILITWIRNPDMVCTFKRHYYFNPHLQMIYLVICTYLLFIQFIHNTCACKQHRYVCAYIHIRN